MESWKFGLEIYQWDLHPYQPATLPGSPHPVPPTWQAAPWAFAHQLPPWLSPSVKSLQVRLLGPRTSGPSRRRPSAVTCASYYDVSPQTAPRAEIARFCASSFEVLPCWGTEDGSAACKPKQKPDRVTFWARLENRSPGDVRRRGQRLSLSINCKWAETIPQGRGKGAPYTEACTPQKYARERILKKKECKVKQGFCGFFSYKVWSRAGG